MRSGVQNFSNSLAGALLSSTLGVAAVVGVGSAHAGAWTKSVDTATAMERRPFFNHNFSPTENAVKV
jgi:hypothetical protein